MGRIRTGDVKVEGLRELNKALKELGGKELQKQLKDVGKEAADELAKRAQGIALGLGGVAAKTAPSIRGGSTTNGADVRFGGAAYPFAGGAEFGAIKYRQFKPWKGNSSGAGYFVYESIRDGIDDIVDEYERGLFDLARRYGLVE